MNAWLFDYGCGFKLPKDKAELDNVALAGLLGLHANPRPVHTAPTLEETFFYDDDRSRIVAVRVSRDEIVVLKSCYRLRYY
jgi:hypothetical protein